MTDNGPDFEAPPDQTEEHVEEAVPHSDIAATVSDVPPDYGDPSVADFPDPAFGEPVEWDTEVPDPGEPEPKDDLEEPEDADPLPDEDEETEEPTLPSDEGDES